MAPLDPFGRRRSSPSAKVGISIWNNTPIGIRAPHFLALEFPDKVPDGLTDRLAAAQVHVSLRGSSLRVTPHVYNTIEDATALITTLRECLG